MRLLDRWAALHPQAADVLAAGQRRLHHVGSLCEACARWELAVLRPPAGEEVYAGDLALQGVAARGQHPNEVILRAIVEGVAHAAVASTADGAVDVGEDPRRVRVVVLPPVLAGPRAKGRAVRRAVVAAGHVRQQVGAVLGPQLDLVVVLAVVVVQALGVLLQRVRGVLPDAHRHRLVEELPDEVVEAAGQQRLAGQAAPCCS